MRFTLITGLVVERAQPTGWTCHKIPQLYAHQPDDGLHVAGFVFPGETSLKPVFIKGEIGRPLIKSLELAVKGLAQPLLDIVAVEVSKEMLLEVGPRCLYVFERIIPGRRGVLELLGHHPLFVVLKLCLVLLQVLEKPDWTLTWCPAICSGTVLGASGFSSDCY